MFVLREGRDNAAVIPSGDTCIGEIHRMRLDTKVEGDSRFSTKSRS